MRWAAIVVLASTACSNPEGEEASRRASAQTASPAEESAPGETASAPGETASAPERWSDPWILEEGRRFLGDTDHRRAALVRSLTNHDNVYSRLRLSTYGLGGGGWDKLPVWNPRSMPVDAALAAQLAEGAIPEVAAEHEPLWDGVEPTTMAGWVELGRRVFFEYPMRAEVFLEFGLTRRELADAVGVERTASGELPGVIVFRNVDGESRVGMTCAICHSAVRDGELVAGAARRSFDYGRLRLAYFAETGEYLAPDLAERMKSWGPGRADVSEDDDEDPVAIPDLWGVRSQSWLTQAGTIRHESPIALAIRQETQLTDSNHALVRPPRELAWALAMYVYSLAPPPRAPSSSPGSQLARGRVVFAEKCGRCHANEAYGGRVIAAATIGTDRELAVGRGRGTGGYRVPPLLAVGDGAPYLHDGSVASLEELLSPDRLGGDYEGGELGPGPILGHTAGTELVPADRQALLAFLQTL